MFLVGGLDQPWGPNPSRGAVVHADRAMARTMFPMDWRKVHTGDPIDLLCKNIAFDYDHDVHIMEVIPQGHRFHLNGLLASEYESYTIFDAVLKT